MLVPGVELGAHAGTSDQDDGQTATERRWPPWPTLLPGLSQLCRCWAAVGPNINITTAPTTTQQHRNPGQEERICAGGIYRL